MKKKERESEREREREREERLHPLIGDSVRHALSELAARSLCAGCVCALFREEKSSHRSVAKRDGKLGVA